MTIAEGDNHNRDDNKDAFASTATTFSTYLSVYSILVHSWCPYHKIQILLEAVRHPILRQPPPPAPVLAAAIATCSLTR